MANPWGNSWTRSGDDTWGGTWGSSGAIRAIGSIIVYLRRRRR